MRGKWQGSKACADKVPRQRSAAISAKAAPDRSIDACGGALPPADVAAAAAAERAAHEQAARAAAVHRQQAHVHPGFGGLSGFLSRHTWRGARRICVQGLSLKAHWDLAHERLAEPGLQEKAGFYTL